MYPAQKPEARAERPGFWRFAALSGIANRRVISIA